MQSANHSDKTLSKRLKIVFKDKINPIRKHINPAKM